jgi:hypothetical protein
MESEEPPFTVIDNRLAQYLILTGYHLYQGNSIEDIPTDSLLNLKELLDLELTYRQGDFH